MNLNIIATYWRKLANGTRNNIFDRLLLALLIPLSLPYALLQSLRAGLYRTGLLKTKRLPRPVISIGNITAGGTGKTPVTALIARLLLKRGLKVVVLSRGYGGTLEGQLALVSDGRNLLLEARQCGDEPFLLARTVPGLAVVIGADRHAAGMLAMELLAPDIFLLDDGFQHLRLQRDLNILLLDCSHPFGNGWTLPAGLLREPSRATKRAGLCIYTRCPEEEPIIEVTAGQPSCNARHKLHDAIPLTGGVPLPLKTFQGRKLLAFAGIAEPQFFFDGLKACGLELAATIAFPDHASYNEARIAELSGSMKASGAVLLITTEKDGVKLKQLEPDLAARTMLARLELSIDNPELLDEMLGGLLGESDTNGGQDLKLS